MPIINIWCILLSVLAILSTCYYFYQRNRSLRQRCLEYYAECQQMTEDERKVEYISLTANRNLWSLAKFSMPASGGTIWMQYKVDINEIIGQLFQEATPEAVDITLFIIILVVILFVIIIRNYKREQIKIQILEKIWLIDCIVPKKTEKVQANK